MSIKWDRDSKEWAAQFKYQLQQLKASRGDFVQALQEVGHSSDAGITALHRAYVNRDNNTLGVIFTALIDSELTRETEELTERYFDHQAETNGKI